MAALMPTSVSIAVRRLGARPKAPWNSTSITISRDHPSSDRATIAATRRGVDACSPADSACCTRGHRASRGTSSVPATSSADVAAAARPESAPAAERARACVTERAIDEDQDGERQHLGAALRERAGVVDAPAATLAALAAQARRADQVAAAEPDRGVRQQALDGRGQHLAERRRIDQRHAPARRLQRQEPDEVQQDRRGHRPRRVGRKRDRPGLLAPQHHGQQAQRHEAERGLPVPVHDAARLRYGLLTRVRRSGRPSHHAVEHVQDPAADPRPVERVGDRAPARDAIALVPLQGVAARRRRTRRRWCPWP